MRDRPRNSKSRETQGVKAKRKAAAKGNGKATPKTKIHGARDELRKEILKGTAPELKKAFDRFSDGCDIQTLISVVGMELRRMQSTLEPGERPDYRYNAAMHRYLDQLRKLVMMREGADSFIPDEMTVTLDVGDDADDTSDEPEFE